MEKQATYYQEYYLKNKEKIIERSRLWAKNNPEKVKKNHKVYILKNSDKLKAAQCKYRKENPKKYLYAIAKRRAKRREQEFTISLSDLLDIPKYCSLLGIEISSWVNEQSHHPSLDRKDSSKGYIPGNVWFISHRANMLKNNATTDELLCLVVNMMEKM